MNVAIIGGGIGGLTTALALKRAGISTTLFEAAPEIKPVGAGIILASNALQVLRHLGVEQEVYRKGYLINRMTISQPDFSPLSSISLQRFEQQYGLQHHAIHRADLHDLLAAAMGHDRMQLNKRLQKVQLVNSRYQLAFEDQTTAEADYVIGADGIKSLVRQQLFQEGRYRDAAQVCWRGVLTFPLPATYTHSVMECWGSGCRFGFVQISADTVYWYLLVNADMERKNTALTDYARDFHPLAAELIRETPADNINRAHLYDLVPLKVWTQGNACLIGDAAHATTPNLGQGACQAIEDAYVIGELAKRYPLSEVFVRYPAIRMKKAHNIVRQSWKLGKISHLKSPAGVALRNFIMRHLTPESVQLKQMGSLFKLDRV